MAFSNCRRFSSPEALDWKSPVECLFPGLLPRRESIAQAGGTRVASFCSARADALCRRNHRRFPFAVGYAAVDEICFRRSDVYGAGRLPQHTARKPSAGEAAQSGERLEKIALFDVEILIDQIELANIPGMNFKREYAALAKAAQQQIATLNNFKRRSVAIHFIFRFRSSGGQRVQVRLAIAANSTRWRASFAWRIPPLPACPRFRRDR